MKQQPNDGAAYNILTEKWFQILAAFLSFVLIIVVLSMPVLALVQIGDGRVVLNASSQAGTLMTLLGAVVAMFGILMAGIFVFMAIRIDRGARVEARDEARLALKETKKQVDEEVKRVKEAGDAQARVLERLFAEQAKQVDEKAKKVDEALGGLKGVTNERIKRRFLTMHRVAKAAGGDNAKTQNIAKRSNLSLAEAILAAVEGE